MREISGEEGRGRERYLLATLLQSHAYNRRDAAKDAADVADLGVWRLLEVAITGSRFTPALTC